MKNKLIDIGGFIEKLIRAGFYLGAGEYLSIKAVLIISQNPRIPDILVLPAFFVAFFGGFMLWVKVFAEPTPEQQREAKRRAELTERVVMEIAEEKGWK